MARLLNGGLFYSFYNTFVMSREDLHDDLMRKIEKEENQKDNLFHYCLLFLLHAVTLKKKLDAEAKRQGKNP